MYCPDGMGVRGSDSRKQDRIPASESNYSDRGKEDCNKATSSTDMAGGKAQKSGCKRQLSKKLFHGKFPSWPEYQCFLNGKKEKEKCRKESEKFQEIGSDQAMERSQSWIWNQEELLNLETSALNSPIIADKKPAYDSGIMLPSPVASSSGKCLSQIASCQLFQADVLSCDRQEESIINTKAESEKKEDNPAEDDSAWFGSGIDGENMIFPPNEAALESSAASSSTTSFKANELVSSNESRSNCAMTELQSPSPNPSNSVETGTEILAAHGALKAVASSTPKDSDEPKTKLSPMYQDYDSETLRRAAAKNREVSKKLFSKLREQQTQRSSPRHERQSSGLSVESNEGFSEKRRLAKSPSQLSSSGTNSVYAESSSGSSGIGTLTTNSAKEYSFSPVIIRSSSSSALSSAGHLASQNNANDRWNTPQQRRNILSMVEAEHADSAVFNPSPPLEKTTQLLTNSHAANRGVSRKIPTYKKKTDRDEYNCARSMPSLAVPQNDKQDRGVSDNFVENEKSSVLNVPTIEASLNRSYDKEPRSVSPIYAVPTKSPESGGERVCGSVTDLEMLAMKSPPPLPRKPPPPLSDLEEDHCYPAIPYDKYSSSPCLLDAREGMYGIHSGREQTEPYGSAVWPKAARSQVVSPAVRQSALPVNSVVGRSANVAVSSGGKPTVQVHPMCQNETGSLAVRVESRESNRSGESPRPPVPRKPEYLQSPNRRNDIYSSQSSISSVETGKVELPFRQEHSVQQLDFAGETDRRLKDILSPKQMVASTEYLEQGSAFEADRKGDNFRLTPRLADSEVSTPAASATKARFLVGIYSSRASPSVQNMTNRDSVDGSDPFQLERKKLELIGSLSRKLRILEEERKAVQEEQRMNEKLGLNILDWLNASAATDYHLSKYRLHVEDTEKITCLHLRLSAQIARVENAIDKLPPDTPQAEKKLFYERRELLVGQREDARSLRNSLDSRGEQVAAFLKELLTEEQLGDYHYFIQMKKKLLVDAREIDDKAKLGMEQKQALENSLHTAASHSSLDINHLCQTFSAA